MSSDRVPALRNQALVGVGVFIFAVLTAWQIGNKVVANDSQTLVFAAMGIAGCFIVVVTMKNWRTGFYLFLVWMMFEDLTRKYMGNGLALFFGKDILLAFVYISLFKASHHEKVFRPPFLLFLSLFFWLGVLQVFNPNSPSIWYGLLGLKIYFYYIPLMFAGYALVRSDEALRKLLVVIAVLSGVVGLLGIAQSILGNSFLNPAHLAPELEELGNLSKSTPLSRQGFNLPDSVFVSSGRYAEYVSLALIVAIGAAGYLMLYTKRSRTLIFATIAILEAAAFLSGNRGCFMYALVTTLLLPLGFLWGAPWRWKQAHRLIRVIRLSVIASMFSLFIIISLFPKEAGSRLAYYTETLLPSSSAYEIPNRVWDYPVHNLLGVFSQPNWIVGNGIGTTSLGKQYVAKLIGKRPLEVGAEEGYGTMIAEMGIVAPFLWILWTAALLYYSWKVIGRLRGTRFLPIALAIVWYVFLVLYPYTYGSLVIYQNYVTSAFLWLLVGILFRLPDLLVNAPSPVIVNPAPRRILGGFQF